jgi:hypothetical protein
MFGVCDIWVILRKNVMYLYSKKPHLPKFTDMMSLGEFLGQKIKEN